MGATTYRCTVIAGDAPVSFDVAAQRPVLHEMILRGQRALPVGCRGGGCGTCRIEVLQGRYTTGRMSKRFVTDDAARLGIALACRTFPDTDIVVRPFPVAPETQPTASDRTT
ncbi:MAG TPA: 2Fe-2S iron-sulfur cluster-binding protein [Ilumatobacteraceae bacterium]|nr:2Fe-2S iron-sulfur cluster-binding protein [Ilumatobacteraceae bacterium]